MRKEYSNKDISEMIGKLVPLADSLEILSGRPDAADTIDEARYMLLYLLNLKKEIHGICNDKS